MMPCMIIHLCMFLGCEAFSFGQPQQRYRKYVGRVRPIYSTASTDVKGVELQHMEFTSPSLTTNDLSHGQNFHEPVILLHGLLGSKKNFASLGSSLERQLKKSRRVFAVDLRNHGENDHDWREDMSYENMAMDVLDFLDRQNFENAILVGHSMGGKVAKALALLYPHRVKGLIILDIAPVRYSPEQDKSWSMVKTVVDALASLPLTPGKTKRDVDFELKATIEDHALRAFVLTNLDSRQQQQQLTWKIDIQSIYNQLHVIAGFDLQNSRDLLYEGDTFFISGGASRFVRSSHMQTIAHYFPNHMLTTIRGAGHWVHAEAPDDTLALLKRYLDR